MATVKCVLGKRGRPSHEMDEYIKRKTVIDLITRRYENPEICMQEINSIPAADVAPVVRCKDCKHKGWVQEPCHGKSVDYCRVWDCTLRNLESTFCSYGEPKEGANADDHD